MSIQPVNSNAGHQMVALAQADAAFQQQAEVHAVVVRTGFSDLLNLYKDTSQSQVEKINRTYEQNQQLISTCGDRMLTLIFEDPRPMEQKQMAFDLCERLQKNTMEVKWADTARVAEELMRIADKGMEQYFGVISQALEARAELITQQAGIEKILLEKTE